MQMCKLHWTKFAMCEQKGPCWFRFNMFTSSLRTGWNHLTFLSMAMGLKIWKLHLHCIITHGCGATTNLISSGFGVGRKYKIISCPMWICDIVTLNEESTGQHKEQTSCSRLLDDLRLQHRQNEALCEKHKRQVFQTALLPRYIPD